MVMENRNQNFNNERNSQNPGMNSSNENTEQNVLNPSNPEGGNWPKDETMKEYLKKNRKNNKMRPGSLDRE
jgi:hypothetical protein